MKPRLYIAGPMTGLPEFNFPAFNMAEQTFRNEFTVINPAKNFGGKTDLPREQYIRKDIEDLLTCDAIALLPGWPQSQGASMEREIARQIGLTVYSIDCGGGGMRLEHWSDTPALTTRSLYSGRLRATNSLDLPVEIVDTPAPVETILQEAGRLTSGDRNSQYGHPLDDYRKTGMIFGAMLHKWAQEAAKHDAPIPVPADLACLMMVGVKLSRQVNKRKRDNLVDGAGYLRCVEMIEVEQERRNNEQAETK